MSMTTTSLRFCGWHRADKAEHRDAGDQNGVGKTGYLRKAPAAQKAEQHKELHQNEAREERVGHRRVLGESSGGASP